MQNQNKNTKVDNKMW